MGCTDGDGIAGSRTLVIAQAGNLIESYQRFQQETMDCWVRLSRDAMRQLSALNMALDYCYRDREVMSRSPAVIELVGALETSVIANADITKRVSEFLLILGELQQGVKKIDER